MFTHKLIWCSLLWTDENHFMKSAKVLSIKVLYMTYDLLKHIDLLKMNFCDPINHSCVYVCAPLSFLNSDNIN